MKDSHKSYYIDIGMNRTLPVFGPEKIDVNILKCFEFSNGLFICQKRKQNLWFVHFDLELKTIAVEMKRSNLKKISMRCKDA